MNRPSQSAAAAVIVVLLISLLMPGCSSYGEVNQKTYEIAKALYSTCNRKDESGLTELSEMIATAEQAGEISSKEAGWLNDIVAQGQSGQWVEAQKMARQLMSDQSDL